MQLRMSCNELKEDVASRQQWQPRALYQRHSSPKAQLGQARLDKQGNRMWLSGFTIWGWKRSAFRPQAARNIVGLFWRRSSRLCISILMLLK